MSSRTGLPQVLICVLILGALCVPLAAQTTGSSAGVPQLIPMYGAVPDDLNKSHNKHVELTFSIYAQPDDVAPLWSETHDVVLVNGQYQVLLGSTTAGGVPLEFFSSGQARWLGVTVDEQPELPRTIFTSMPYALKASDAETLGGKPVSAFAMSDGTNSPAPKTAVSFTATAGPGFISLATAGPPLRISSTDLVQNLNADLLDGFHARDLQADNQQLQANIDAEAAARQAADSAEAGARQAADTTLQGNLNAEAASRAAADTALQMSLNSEVVSRQAADMAEAGARAAADTTLQGNLNAEAASRTTADMALQMSLDNEAAARHADDAVSAHLTSPNLFQSPGTVIPQVLGPVDQATNAPATGFASNPLDLVASAFNSRSSAAVDQLFRWHAEPVASNTPNPTGRLTLHYGAGGNPPAPTGLALNADGTITFAAGQTFPPNVGDITAVNVGGAAAGAAMLSLDVPFTDARYPRLATANTFVGDQSVVGNVLATGNVGAANIGASGTITATNVVTTNVTASAGSIAATNLIASGGLSAGTATINGLVAAQTGLLSASTTNQVLLVNQLGNGSAVNAVSATTDPGMGALVGVASASAGSGHGVLGSAVNSPNGVGVQGTALATGVIGNSIGDTGVGVAGLNQTATGATTGVLAQVLSSSGSAGVFQAPGVASANLIVGKTSGSPVTIRFRVDGAGRTFANQFTTPASDFAESILTAGDKSSYEAGDVLVIDPGSTRRVDRSSEPYSTLVAGIYSTQPGMLATSHDIDAPELADEVPLAIVGIVPCKVSAENGQIQSGDLLVTSSTPGYAMKGTDRSRMLGAIVGKALGALAEGTGVIEVLVTLQ